MLTLAAGGIARGDLCKQFWLAPRVLRLG